MQRAEAEAYCRERTNKNCDPRISYKVGKSHTGEFYVVKSVHGREDSRIYSTSVEAEPATPKQGMKDADR